MNILVRTFILNLFYTVIIGFVSKQSEIRLLTHFFENRNVITKKNTYDKLRDNKLSRIKNRKHFLT